MIQTWQIPRLKFLSRIWRRSRRKLDFTVPQPQGSTLLNLKLLGHGILERERGVGVQ